jgi:hypothetical protein
VVVGKGKMLNLEIYRLFHNVPWLHLPIGIAGMEMEIEGKRTATDIYRPENFPQETLGSRGCYCYHRIYPHQYSS